MKNLTACDDDDQGLSWRIAEYGNAHHVNILDGYGQGVALMIEREHASGIMAGSWRCSPPPRQTQLDHPQTATTASVPPGRAHPARLRRRQLRRLEGPPPPVCSWAASARPSTPHARRAGAPGRAKASKPQRSWRHS